VPEEVMVRRARWWTLIYGVLVTFLAFVISQFKTNLVESVNTIIGLVGGPMVGLFLLGMFTKRADQRGAIIGGIVGLAASLYLSLHVSFLWLTMCGTLVTILVGWITSGRSVKP
jgi:sodium-coupled monocarboxylate transporter 8/12